MLSHIDYGNFLLADLSATRLYPLQKAQNAAAGHYGHYSRHYGRSSTRPNEVTFERSPLAAYLLQDSLQDHGFDLLMFERFFPLVLV